MLDLDLLNIAGAAVKVATHLFVEKRLVMDLIQLVVVLIVVGVLLWLINNYIPMDSKIKQILNIVVVIAVVLWLLGVFGVLSSFRGIRVGK